jgi:hypothetical protein
MPIPLGTRPARDLARLRSATRALKAAIARNDPRYPVTEDALANADETELFAVRRSELKRCLEPASTLLAEPILGLLTAMPSQSGAGLDQAMRLGTFIEDLADMPFFAVEQACRDFRRGVVGDKHWAPTAAELRERAEYHARAYRVELAEIDEILVFADEHRGKIPDRTAEEDERERIKGKFADLAKSFKKIDPDAVENTRAEAQAALDRMVAEGPWAPKLSERALATIREATNPIETEEDLKSCLR